MESINSKIKTKLRFLKPSSSSEKVEAPLNVCAMIPEPNRTQRTYRSLKKKFTRCLLRWQVWWQTNVISDEPRLAFPAISSHNVYRPPTSNDPVPSHRFIYYNRNNAENYDRPPPPPPPRSPFAVATVRDCYDELDETQLLPPIDSIMLYRQSREVIIYVNDPSDDRNNSFLEEYAKLLFQCYYWGPITRQEAEDLLRNQADGTFLIRDSASQRYLFSLSFRSFGKTLHTRIEYSSGKFSISDNQEFNNIVELIEQAMIDSKNSVCCFSRSRTSMDPIYPVRLINPLSRMNRIQSLKHMCRFLIRQQVNINDIDTLKLPKSVKDYLKERYL